MNRLKKAIQVKDINLRQIGVVASGHRAKKNNALSKMDDATMARTMTQCEAACGIMVNNIRNNMWRNHKFLQENWPTWSTNKKTVCYRLMKVVAKYLPKEWGKQTFWSVHGVDTVWKMLKDKRANSNAGCKNIFLGA